MSNLIVSYPIGTKIRVQGLRNRTDLNGLIGTVQEYIVETSRWRVILSNNVVVALKGENILVESKSAHPLGKDPDSILEDCLSSLDISPDSNPFFCINPNIRVVSKMETFFPFGNTPAKLLVSNIPVHVDRARILLLGCGDARHILFTIYATQSMGGLAAQQSLDIVACDHEPSILARNILLFKLIENEAVDMDIIWALFFSKKIDQRCMQVLVTTSNLLIENTSSWEHWHGTVLGSILRFCDHRTMSMVRDIWRCYSRGAVSTATAKQFRSHCQYVVDKTKGLYIGLSLALTAPCIGQALMNSALHSDITHEYISSQIGIPACTYTPQGEVTINPMMLRGRGQIADWHFTSDPTVAFHSSLAYLSTSSSTTALPQTQDIWNSCKYEFLSWCQVMRTFLADPFKRSQLIVRQFCGDLYDCCHAIGNIRAGNVVHLVHNDASWATSLQPDIPTSFDLIDTSNCVDYSGLLNILLSCRALLRPGADYARISTMFLSSYTKELNTMNSIIEKQLRCDLSTFAALTGLHCVEAFTQTTEFFRNSIVGMDDLYPPRSRIQQLYLVVDWILQPIPSFVPMQLQPKQVAESLLVIYERIFKPYYSLPDMESISSVLELSCDGSDYGQPTSQTFALLVYHSFMYLGILGQKSAQVAAMHLMNQIADLPLLLQGNQIQDLMLWMHLLGLITDMDYKSFTDVAMRQFGSSLRCPIKPKYHQVVLFVPRSVIDNLTSTVNKSPLLTMCMECNHKVCNFSASFHMGFAQDVLYHSSLPMESRVITKNFTILPGDKYTYRYLVCTALIPFPSSHFAKPEQTIVRLQLSQSMARREPNIMYQLGPHLEVFRALASDHRHVQMMEWDGAELSSIIQNLYGSTNITPLSSSSAAPLLLELKSSELKRTVAVTATPWDLSYCSDGKIIGCQTTIAFDEIALNDLNPLRITDRAHPLSLRLHVKPPSTSDLTIPIDRDYVDLWMPMHLDCSRGILQLTKKATVLSLCLPFMEDLPLGPSRIGFMTASRVGHYSLVQTPRVLLDAMPIVHLPPTASQRAQSWLSFVLAAQVFFQDKKPATPRSALDGLRQSIATMVLGAHLQSSERAEEVVLPHKFLLTDAESTSSSSSSPPHILVYLNHLRVDLGQDALVLDVAVCCITKEMMASDMARWITAHQAEICVLPVSREELDLWRKQLPVWAERTRNDWMHESGCEYFPRHSHLAGTMCLEVPVRPKAPLGGAPTVCRCCLGKSLETTLLMEELQANNEQHLRRHFFRAAISPMYNAFQTIPSASKLASFQAGKWH